MMSTDDLLAAIEAQQSRQAKHLIDIQRGLIDIKDGLALVHQVLSRIDERMEKAEKHHQDPQVF